MRQRPATLGLSLGAPTLRAVHRYPRDSPPPSHLHAAPLAVDADVGGHEVEHVLPGVRRAQQRHQQLVQAVPKLVRRAAPRDEGGAELGLPALRGAGEELLPGDGGGEGGRKRGNKKGGGMKDKDPQRRKGLVWRGG